MTCIPRKMPCQGDNDAICDKVRWTLDISIFVRKFVTHNSLNGPSEPSPIEDSEVCRARQSTLLALPCSGSLSESRTPKVAEHARAHGLLCPALATYRKPGLQRLQSTPEHMGCSALLWQLIRIQDSEACRARQNTWVAAPCSGTLSDSRTPKVAEQARTRGLLCLALPTYQNIGLRRLQNKPKQMGCSALLWQLIRIQDTEGCRTNKAKGV